MGLMKISSGMSSGGAYSNQSPSNANFISQQRLTAAAAGNGGQSAVKNSF
jgi:hypothetical protein